MEHSLAELTHNHSDVAEHIVASIVLDEHHQTKDQLLPRVRESFAAEVFRSLADQRTHLCETPFVQSNSSTRLGLSPRVFVDQKYLIVGSVWLLTGIACTTIDERVQPCLTQWGAQGTSLHAIAESWQQLGAKPGIVLFLCSALLVSGKPRTAVFIRFAACVSLAGILSQVAKYLIGRVRPNVVGDTTHYLGPLGIFNEGPWAPIDSMPSGHTAAAFSMAVALTHRWPRLGVLWFFLAAGVGVARTLVDRHFPSDVILGALLGTAVAVVTLRYAINSRVQFGQR
jgi:undecaprenyl-diphosphatase